MGLRKWAISRWSQCLNRRSSMSSGGEFAIGACLHWSPHGRRRGHRTARRRSS
uniref:Uncharacterized protein n=1 Tax=Arundo donax TaxID=35708 RepID=A0A0A9FVR3_ARUDO